jgi:hypothetical protein
VDDGAAIGAVIAAVLLAAMVRGPVGVRLAPYHLSYGIRLSDGIDAPTNERATARYEALEQQKEALEHAYGRALTWETLPGRRAYRIADYRPGEITRTEEHGAYMDFFLDAGQRMRQALAAIELPD